MYFGFSIVLIDWKHNICIKITLSTRIHKKSGKISKIVFIYIIIAFSREMACASMDCYNRKSISF